MCIVSVNIDQLPNKFNELLSYIEINKPDVICVTEVKPKNCPNFDDSVFNIKCYRKLVQPKGRAKRGILIYVHDSIDCSYVPELNNLMFNESLFCLLNLPSETIVLGAIYRSPSSDEINNEALLTTLTKAASFASDKRLILAGDFNFGTIDWENLTTPHGNDHPATKFLHATQDSFLFQFVEGPTRFKNNQHPSRLDLVFSNKPDSINSIFLDSPIGKGDHATLRFHISCHKTSNQSKTKSYNFFKGDYESIKLNISNIDWSDKFKDKNTQQSWELFKHTLNENIAKHIPLSKKKDSFSNPPLWMNHTVKKSINYKKKCWRKYHSQQTQWSALKFKKARNQCTNIIRKTKIEFERKIAFEVKTNPKSFWKYVKSQTKYSDSIPNLKKDDSSFAETDKDKAELLNSFFSSVFTKDDNLHPNLPTRNYNSILSDMECTPEEVQTELNKLNTNKTPGPDGLHPRILNELSSVIALPLCHIFNLSLKESYVPEDWRTAYVVPIFKKGEKSSPGNYRPVSLTSIICKVLEKLIRDKLVHHLESNNLLCDDQFGFRKNRSCALQLLEVLNDWTKAINEGSDVDVIFLDFSKAFDSVSHSRLSTKLKSYGIDGDILNWITKFLSNRVQRVRVGNTLSSALPVESGVPQGSILGPVLFLIFINDLPDNVNSSCKIFADDTKIYSRISSQEDHESLQNDINELFNWSMTWKLMFNASKCAHMHIGSLLPVENYSIHNANNEETVINVSQCEKDLGVFINNNLTPSNHISESVHKAQRVLWCIKQSFSYLEPDMFVVLYKTLVRPILEYASPVWSPFLLKDIRAIEQVQRRATKLIPSIHDKSYTDRMVALGLPTLQYRRDRQDLIQVYSLLSASPVSSLFSVDSSQRLRGNGKRLLKTEHHNKQLRQKFFSQRVINTWNKLPYDVVNASTLNQFKSSLNSINWNPNKFISV